MYERKIFMFDVNNTDMIKTFIDLRDLSKGDIVIPVYLLIGNTPYAITEIDDIEYCSSSMIKVVFGSSNSVFKPYGFPASDLIRFSNVKRFSHYDEDKQFTTDYVLFESDGIDEPTNPLDENINKWYNLISDKILKIVEIKRRNRLKHIMEE